MAKGVVRHLRRHRGFAVIKAEDGKEMFFHMAALHNIRFDLLKEGDSVEFNIVQERKELKPVNIEVKERRGSTKQNWYGG